MIKFTQLHNIIQQIPANIKHHTNKHLQSLKSNITNIQQDEKQILDDYNNQFQILNYIPNNSHQYVTDVIKKQTPISSVSTKNRDQIIKRNKKIHQIQDQKFKIQQQLKQLTEQIYQLKQQAQPVKQNHFKKYKSISQDPVAFQNAQKLLARINQSKKEFAQKKLKLQTKLLEQLNQSNKNNQLKKQLEYERLKQLKRQQIAKRLSQQKKRKQERKIIEFKSNMVIKQIQQQQKLKNMLRSKSVEVEEISSRKFGKGQNLDLKQIGKHQKKYFQIIKQRTKTNQIIHQQGEINQPVKYKKGLFYTQLEEQERKKKQQEIKKQRDKKSNYGKRMKYGQLVKKILLSPKQKSNQTSEIILDPKKSDYSKNNRSFIRSTVTKKISHDISSLPKLNLIQQNQINQQKKQQRLIRERELRKKTNQRLKILEEKQLEIKKLQSERKPSRKHYKNYLISLPRNNYVNQWKKIDENKYLSNEEKIQNLIEKANFMEHKAKFKQQMGNYYTNEDSTNLYIASIQVKMALLDKL